MPEPTGETSEPPDTQSPDTQSPDTQSPDTQSPDTQSPDTQPTEPAKKTSRWRIVALVVFFLGSLAIAKWTGVTDSVDVETIRAWMDEAGPLGFVGFVVAFAVGELMHIPGVVFVGAASVAYGNVLGSLAAYLGAIASVTTSFFVVRLIGGQPLGEVKRPFVRKMLDRLDRQPIRTVAILRLIFWMAPALNYALAMSKIRFREYLLGSALGLLIPIPLVAIFFDWIVSLPFIGG